jgi:hypothetical protein
MISTVERIKTNAWGIKIDGRMANKTKFHVLTSLDYILIGRN